MNTISWGSTGRNILKTLGSKVEESARHLTGLFFFFIFGCIGSSLLCASFSLVAASGGYSLLWCTGFSLRWLLSLWNTDSRHTGFSSCGTQAQ